MRLEPSRSAVESRLRLRSRLQSSSSCDPRLFAFGPESRPVGECLCARNRQAIATRRPLDCCSIGRPAQLIKMSRSLSIAASGRLVVVAPVYSANKSHWSRGRELEHNAAINEDARSPPKGQRSSSPESIASRAATLRFDVIMYDRALVRARKRDNNAKIQKYNWAPTVLIIQASIGLGVGVGITNPRRIIRSANGIYIPMANWIRRAFAFCRMQIATC